MIATVSEKSIRAFCPNNRVVVYGFQECKCLEIYSFLKEEGDIDTYRHDLGDGFSADYFNLIGDEITPLPLAEDETVSRICKTALVHLVLDNYRRQFKCETITPLIFCIDSDNNRYPRPDITRVFSSEKELKNTITHRELRRVAKLMFDQQVHEDLRKIALETFKFVHVHITHIHWEESMELEGISMPFTESQFHDHYAKLKMGKISSKSDDSNWRILIEDRRKDIVNLCNLRNIG